MQPTPMDGRSGQQQTASYQSVPAFVPQFPTGFQQSVSAGFGSSYSRAFGNQPPMGYHQGLHNSYNQATQQSSVPSQRSSTMSSPASNNHAQPVLPQAHPPLHSQWSQSYYQSPYQGPTTQYQLPTSQQQQYQHGTVPPSSIPYPYGQLPFQPGQHNQNQQHPLPGSFNRQAFNPRTQSFIPGGSLAANLAANYGPPSYSTRTGSYNQPATSQVPFNIQQQGFQYPKSSSFGSSQQIHANGGKPFTNHTSVAQPHQVPATGQSSLSKWGTPAHLPPKPPPPQNPNFLDNQRSLPSNIYSASTAQPYGQHAHTIHHGLSANGNTSTLPTSNTSINMA